MCYSMKDNMSPTVESTKGVIVPPRVIYAEALPDYSERLARRTGVQEVTVKAKLQPRKD